MTPGPITLPSRVSRAADAIEAAFEAHFWRWALLFGIGFVACTIGIDLRKKMWIDELYTLYMARQAGLREIVRATLDGCDGASPLYAMIVHGILPWVRNEALAVRLPSTLGFTGMIFTLLAFCRRRWPAPYAAVPALAGLPVCLRYATEGRSYGLVLGCTALALLCWQAAAEGRRRRIAIPLLAVSLMLGVALHYFAVFLTAPLLAAELARWVRTRRPDFGVLAALACPLPVLGLHYPLIAAGKVFQAHYWSPAYWSVLPDLYVDYATKICLIPALVLIALWNLPDRLLAGGRRPCPSGLDMPECVVAAACLLAPAGVFVLSKYVTGVFVSRYVLWAAVGVGIGIGHLLYNAGGRKPVIAIGMTAALLSTVAARQALVLYRTPLLAEGETVFRDLDRLPDQSLPVVVANHHVFMELSYYAGPGLRDRLIYPVSRNLDLRYLQVDTGALLLSALGRHSRIQVIDYDKVLRTYPHFILAAVPGDYLPHHLLASGYRLIPAGGAVSTLYEVQAEARASRLH
jgi:hypothetical protein